MGGLTPDHMVTIIVTLLSALGVVTAAALTALAALLKVRADKQVAEANVTAQAAVTKAQIDQQIDTRLARDNAELAAKVENLEAKVDSIERLLAVTKGAFTRILRALAIQWPGAVVPNLDPADIALIEDTIPPHWIRPSRPRTGPISHPPKESL